MTLFVNPPTSISLTAFFPIQDNATTHLINLQHIEYARFFNESGCIVLRFTSGRDVKIGGIDAIALKNLLLMPTEKNQKKPVSLPPTPPPAAIAQPIAQPPKSKLRRNRHLNKPA